MKSLAALVLPLIAFAGSASASQITLTCGSFSSQFGTSGSFTCPGVAGLGLGDLASISGFVVYDNDYSNGLSDHVTTQTVFTLSNFDAGESADVLTDTVTSTGDAHSNLPTAASGLPFNAIALPVLAGFYDNLTGVTQTSSGFDVGFVNTIPQGSVVAATGYAQVVYDYTVATTESPEPVSMVLFGSSLMLVPFLKRRKAL